jgi:hypothetical protein
MTDTHIHIHLNGETMPQAATSPKKSSKRKVSPPGKTQIKPKRAVSPYHKTVGAEMKKLKKAGFRGNVMKKAHANAKKKHKGRKKR